MYTLVTDDDGHWYVIPTDKRDEFEDIIYGEDPYSIEDQGWAERVGGHPSLVSFPSYEIK